MWWFSGKRTQQGEGNRGLRKWELIISPASCQAPCQPCFYKLEGLALNKTNWRHVFIYWQCHGSSCTSQRQYNACVRMDTIWQTLWATANEDITVVPEWKVLNYVWFFISAAIVLYIIMRHCFAGEIKTFLVPDPATYARLKEVINGIFRGTFLWISLGLKKKTNFLGQSRNGSWHCIDKEEKQISHTCIIFLPKTA